MATISKNLTVAAKNVYTLTINNIPTGSSVTPVNDIQTWLHCADIWNKTYTTIAQVLSDASTLQVLIASNNAADYMSRSTSWANSVTANANAMTYIGNNNYCADKLLANTTWLNAICNSTYFESVLNVKVPTMTSNTTPSGECIMSSVAESEDTYNGYKAFDGNNSTYWAANSYANEYVGYKFTNNVKIYKCRMYIPPTISPYGNVKNYKIQSSSDNGTTWNKTLYTGLVPSNSSAQTINVAFNNADKVKAYRLFVVDEYDTGRYIWLYELQFYGRA